MLVSNAVEMFLNHHRANSTASTLRNYTWLLSAFAQRHADRELQSLQTDEVLDFLNQNTGMWFSKAYGDFGHGML